MVCDNAMGLPERTGTDVLEVVVPSDYKCPNGGKFKARALHWGALHGSSARRHDWIIHMDEETRFDVDTVRATRAQAEEAVTCAIPTCAHSQA